MPKSQMPVLELPPAISRLFDEAAAACQNSLNCNPRVTKHTANAIVNAVLALKKYEKLKSVKRYLLAYVEYLVGLR